MRLGTWNCFRGAFARKAPLSSSDAEVLSCRRFADPEL